ncbi:MAG TPA: twin-arginine translocase TatA/TatE family subunit [Planctomycetes bacterium]|nr:twin-arginine translocase TatA/TatE family subunit [Planctomycetota bacterium]
MTLAFGLPSGPEWIVVLVVALLIFGSRLPKVMRSLGQSVNEFKRGMNDIVDADESGDAAKKDAEKDEAKA